MYFLLRLLINAAALWVAIQVVGGIDHRGSWRSLLAVALVFGVLNAGIRPLLKLLSIPLLTGWVSGLRISGFTSTASGLRSSAASSSAS